MRRQLIAATVVGVVRKEMLIAKHIPEDAPLADYGVDSLRAITIMYGLEDIFSIEIATEDIEKVKTINDIVDIIYNEAKL